MMSLRIRNERRPGLRRILFLLILGFFVSMSPAAEEPTDSSAGSGESLLSQSRLELEREILSEQAWLAEADRLMKELETIDVQLYVRLARVSDGESRNRLLRERKNIRRLMVDLVESRNLVETRLAELRGEYRQLEPSPGPAR